MRKLFSILIFTLAASFAHAENVEADFSFFHDPNEAMPEKASTQAELPCISCQNSSTKPKNVQENEVVIKKVQKEADCITCGKVKLEQPVVSKSKTTSVGSALWSQFPSISGYSNSAAVAKMIRWVESNSKRVSGGQCYRYVKEALCGADRPACKSKLVSKYLHGTPVFPEVPSRSNPKIGQNAVKNLKSEGFINLLESPVYSQMIKNPAAAPKGAIMVYQGGKNGGHIEIKTGHGTSGSYISDYRAPDSVMQNELAGRASKNYKLVAVMIKPAEKIK